jgi:hypothetical protein
MITIDDIYQGAERFINSIIRKELDDQGHTLDGTLSDSLTSRTKKTGASKVMEGMAIYYAQFVDQGVKPESASMKQFPFVKAYFIKRGFSDEQAGGFAAATIKKWMKEGMSTNASKRFSKTGARQQAIESAFVGNSNKIDDYMEKSFDFYMDELYKSTKSETI